MDLQENYSNKLDNSKVDREIRLVDIPVTDENTALNMMVNFLHLAQKRGAFNFDESAKIWECIKIFQKPPN